MNGEVLGNALLVRRSNVAATHWHEFISHSTTEGSNRAAVRVCYCHDPRRLVHRSSVVHQRLP